MPITREPTITRSASRKRLAVLWFVGAGTIFFLLLFQSLLGRYADRVDEAWSWLLPTIMPSLSLIVGVLVADALATRSASVHVSRFVFRLAFSLSAVYLLVVSLTILLSPFATVPALELMDLSNLWLGPLQGLVSAALGAFFVNRKDGAA